MNVTFTRNVTATTHFLCFEMTDAEACMALGIAEGIARAMRGEPPQGAPVPSPATKPPRPSAVVLAGAGPAMVKLDTHDRESMRKIGYEGDPCNDCGQFMLVRNGTCLKCDGCGATSGCS